MKKLLYILIVLISLPLMLIFGYIQYIKSSYNDSFSDEEFTQICSEIQNVPDLPIEFVAVYNKVYSTTNTNGSLFNSLIEKYDAECPCRNIARLNFASHHSDKFKRNDIALSWKLEEQFSQNECLNYYAYRFDFIYNTLGVKDASLFYFKKPLCGLNEVELVGLVLMMKNPSLFNPKKQPMEFKENLIKTLIKVKED